METFVSRLQAPLLFTLKYLHNITVMFLYFLKLFQNRVLHDYRDFMISILNFVIRYLVFLFSYFISAFVF